MPDAVVIGSGVNGLTSANLLAQRGWSVLVLEAEARPGGAVRSGELTLPGFTHDLFSSFYPFAVASPVLRRMQLERHGLRWRRAPLVLAHPAADGSCPVLSQDLDETAASLDAFAPGDGDAWRRMYALWERTGSLVMDAFTTPFPPLRPAAALALRLRRPRTLARFGRFMALPVRRLGEEWFAGDGGPRLVAGNALHADLAPELPGSGAFGWMMCALGQEHGYPVPEGGAQGLTDALVHRLRAHGGELRCGEPVTRVLVRRGRAVGVRTAGGEEIGATHGVLADVTAPALYGSLLERDDVPRPIREELAHFQRDDATVKVDWALSGPIPWTAAPARRAGTVHVADSVDELSEALNQMARGLVPARPFLVMGQYSMTDPTRQPAGAETAWAYTHVPQQIRGDAGDDDLAGRWDERETDRFAARIEARVEALAPGFRDLIQARHVFVPPTMERADANLLGGMINGGTGQLHQMFPFRPLPSHYGRAASPVRGLFLASASAHPSGGVHGSSGSNAARAAVAARLRARVRR
jgi:phytoene dehydrogenase-like protein